MANALSMVAGEGEHSFDPLGAFMAGRRARFDDTVRKNALADKDRENQARLYLGNALRGDSGAKNDLAGADPGAFMQLDKFQRGNEAEELERIGRGAYDADTPEKWAQFVQFGKARGWNFDPEEEDFNNRDAIISQARSIKDRLAQQNADRRFTLDQGNVEEDNAAKREQLRISQQNADTNRQRYDSEALNARRARDAVNAGLQPGTPEYQSYVLTGKIQRTRTFAPSAAMLKLKRQTESDLTDLENTLRNLNEADAYAADAYEGIGASQLGYIGTRVPGGSLITDPKKAAATSNFQKIMSPEAIEQMADTLKGATTDFELREFTKMLADPTAPMEQKRAVIRRMGNLANAKFRLEQARLAEFNQGNDAPGAEPIPKPLEMQDQVPAQDADGGSGTPETFFETADEIPEGAVVVDENTGQAFRKENGQMIPVQ